MFVGQVSHCLNEILDLCQSFCGLISHSEAVLSAQESARLEDIAVVCNALCSCSLVVRLMVIKTDKQTVLVNFVMLAVYLGIFLHYLNEPISYL